MEELEGGVWGCVGEMEMLPGWRWGGSEHVRQKQSRTSVHQQAVDFLWSCSIQLNTLNTKGPSRTKLCLKIESSARIYIAACARKDGFWTSMQVMKEKFVKIRAITVAEKVHIVTLGLNKFNCHECVTLPWCCCTSSILIVHHLAVLQLL